MELMREHSRLSMDLLLETVEREGLGADGFDDLELSRALALELVVRHRAPVRPR